MYLKGIGDTQYGDPTPSSAPRGVTTYTPEMASSDPLDAIDWNALFATPPPTTQDIVVQAPAAPAAQVITPGIDIKTALLLAIASAGIVAMLVLRK